MTPYSAKQDAMAFYIVPSPRGKFQLWAKFPRSESTMSFSRFHGFNDIDGGEIWARERSDAPEYCMGISPQQGMYLLDIARQDYEGK